MDVSISAAALALVWPLMLIVALAVRISSGRPVLFAQLRAGLGGKAFRIYKFRTMVPDAEARKGEVAHLNEMTGPVFKASRDPRVTGIGRALRRLSLDELPQLWNVLKGDMSVVGPRPLPLDEAAACGPGRELRESVRPGLVCLWQVRGRSSIRSFDEWLRLDLRYVERRSVWLDLDILTAAIPAVLFGQGAR